MWRQIHLPTRGRWARAGLTGAVGLLVAACSSPPRSLSALPALDAGGSDGSSDAALAQDGALDGGGLQTSCYVEARFLCQAFFYADAQAPDGGGQDEATCLASAGTFGEACPLRPTPLGCCVYAGDDAGASMNETCYYPGSGSCAAAPCQGLQAACNGGLAGRWQGAPAPFP
jgi:hypothetical protein